MLVHSETQAAFPLATWVDGCHRRVYSAANSFQGNYADILLSNGHCVHWYPTSTFRAVRPTQTLCKYLIYHCHRIPLTHDSVRLRRRMLNDNSVRCSLSRTVEAARKVNVVSKLLCRVVLRVIGGPGEWLHSKSPTTSVRQ